MSHQKLFSCAIALVVLLSCSARSQEPAGVSAESEIAAVRKKAIDLLESVARQVESLRSAENRARIRSNAGDLLWIHDEKRARSLFAVVAEDINTGFSDTDSDEISRDHTLMVFGQLRRDTLARIAKHDPELALEFFQSTRPPSHIKLPYQMRDTDKSLESSLAIQVAAKNPQLALKLGRQSLASGFSPDLVSILSQLQRRDKDTALSFYKEIVEKLKSTNLGQDSIATLVAVRLARSFPVPGSDDVAYRDLTGLLLANALASGCSDASEDYPPEICIEIGRVVSQIEKYQGSKAAPLRRWMEPEPEGPSEEVWEEVRTVVHEGSVNDILALAGKYPEMNRQVHWAAARKAVDLGDVKRARQIASEFPEEEQRREMLAQIERDQMSKAVNAEKLAEIQRQVGGMRNNYERTSFLFYMAGQIGGTDRKAALTLLNQAAQIIDSGKPDKSHFQTQIRLALLYCSLKSDRGFVIVESMLPKLNELVTAAAALNGFENHYLRDGEWNMTGEGALGGILTDLAQSAGLFAALDFDRSVALSSQLERPELRLMAQLKIAQGVLSIEPNVLLKFKGEEELLR